MSIVMTTGPVRGQNRDFSLSLAVAGQGRLLNLPGLGWHPWEGCRWAVVPGDPRHAAGDPAVRNARRQASSMKVHPRP
jgi:hypothetical protein